MATITTLQLQKEAPKDGPADSMKAYMSCKIGDEALFKEQIPKTCPNCKLSIGIGKWMMRRAGVDFATSTNKLIYFGCIVSHACCMLILFVCLLYQIIRCGAINIQIMLWKDHLQWLFDKKWRVYWWWRRIITPPPMPIVQGATCKFWGRGTQ